MLCRYLHAHRPYGGEVYIVDGRLSAETDPSNEFKGWQGGVYLCIPSSVVSIENLRSLIIYLQEGMQKI